MINIGRVPGARRIDRGLAGTELDLWDGKRDDEPVILHGYTLVPEIQAKVRNGFSLQ